MLLRSEFSLETRRRCRDKKNLASTITAFFELPAYFALVISMKFLFPEYMYLTCASVCATIGAVYDLRTRRIPNLLTASSLIFGLLLHLAVGGWKPMGMAALAGLAGGAVFFIFFVIGGMGAGDIKLMAAVACIAGFGHLMEIFVATALMGGVFALVLAISHGRLKATLMNVGALMQHHAMAGLRPHPELHVLNSNTLRLPYATAITAGCWTTLLARTVLR